MKIVKFLDDKTIILEIQEGVCVTIHSHSQNECEIQFGGITGKVVLSTPPFEGNLETSGGSNIIFARYKPRNDSCTK